MRADWTDWMTGASTAVHAQILQFRGMSWRVLGETMQARLWLERARDYAQEHRVNQVFFEVEALLAHLNEPEAAPVAHDGAAEAASESDLPVTEMSEIRGGVGALRRSLAPAFS